MFARCCVLLFAGILLVVQAPWAHTMPQLGPDVVHAAATDAPPCHGEAPAAPQPADDGCCDGIDCSGYCAHPAWAPSSEPQVTTILWSLPPVSSPPVRWSGGRPDKLLRPPI